MMTQTTKLYSIIAGTLLVVAVVGLFVGERYVRGQGERLQAAVGALATHTAEEQSYKELSQLVDTSSSTRTELRSRLLTESRTITFLTMIEHDAAVEGVQLTTNTLQAKKTKQAFDTLEISFSLSGTTSAIRQVIRLFETLPYDGYVSNVQLVEHATHGTATSSAALTYTVGLLKQ